MLASPALLLLALAVPAADKPAGEDPIPEITLRIGSPAPALEPAKWIKGKPEAAAKDKVRVVEFWATWCGPCRVSIPHLTELAKKHHGKVDFIGVSVYEHQKDDSDDSYFPKVEEFVKKLGDKMDYNVAVDGPKKAIAKAWMEASGSEGIPTAFVIGRDNKVAWIGHPLDDTFDDVLTQVVKGTYDSKPLAAKRLATLTAAAKKKKALARLSELLKERKQKEALAELDNVVKAHPEYAADLRFLRINLTFAVDEKAAQALAKELAEGECKDDARTLSFLAQNLVRPGQKSPDYALAVTLATRACELTKHEDPNSLSTLAEAYFGKGDTAKAVEFGEKALKTLDGKPNVSEAYKKNLETRLEKYRKKA